MWTVELKLPFPHPSQETVIGEASRFNVVACGRRWGKSTLGVNRLIVPAVQGYPVCWCSPTYRTLQDIWEILRDTLQPLTQRLSVSEHRITLETRGTVDMWSLDEPDSVRGHAYRRIIVDEAATVREFQYAWEQVLRPTLTDYGGDAWFLSTPKSLNFFYVMWQRGQSAADPDWMSWQYPTSENPRITQDEIASAKRELPERVFAQEYEAKFLETEGAVFRRVLEAIRPEPSFPPPGIQPQYVIGIDWARLQDFTVYCVLEVTTRSVVAVDRFQEIDYTMQLNRLRALCGRYPPLRVIAERNAVGDPLVEQLRHAGVPVWPYLTTQTSKRTAIEALQLAFEQGQITIPPDPVLSGELMAYTAERLPSGMIRYEAPPGGHDDCVMALALAWQAVGAPAQTEFLQKAYGW